MRDEPGPAAELAASVRGVGVRWALSTRWFVPIRPEFEFYWGYRLRNVPRPGGPLQDNGIHLQFALGLL